MCPWGGQKLVLGVMDGNHSSSDMSFIYNENTEGALK